MKKASYLKAKMSFADFAIALIKWADGLLVSESDVKKLTKMAPKLYKDKAIVAIVAMMKTTLEFLGDDFDWAYESGEHTWLERSAMDDYDQCSCMLCMLVFNVKTSIGYYKANAEE